MGFSSGRRLPHQLLTPDLRSQGERCGGEGLTASRGDRELKARKKDTDDHR